MPSVDQQEDTRERLLNNVKKEVKQLMEFSVSCKFIHEDNCCINSLCASIDACLLHGLKPDLMHNKRNSYELLKKISKDCKEGRLILEICENLSDEYTRSNANNSSSTNKTSIFGIEKIFSSTSNSNNNNNKAENISNELIRSYTSLFKSNLGSSKLFWLKVALIEKKINTIVEEIQKSASKYYSDYALMCDSVYGPMVAELLAGPCALEYTRIKTCDNLLTASDQNADELIQRHKMHSQLITGYQVLGASAVKPNWISERILNSSAHPAFNNSTGSASTSVSWTCLSPVKTPKTLSRHNGHVATATVGNVSVNNYNPKEYVESLHQNLKTQLIYGKNHICVNKRNVSIPGYLSLHSSQSGLILNWTPNELLNISSDQQSKPPVLSSLRDIIHIEIDKISYFCCNLRLDYESIIIFVAHDGVQYPSFVFPLGTHLLQFLNCLENSILPSYRLEPVGWEDMLTKSQEPFILKKTLFEVEPSKSVSDSLDMSYSIKSPLSASMCPLTPKMPTPRAENRVKLRTLCADMRYRIMSRAFYGWYKHCKQTKTLKNHLFKLILPQDMTHIEDESSNDNDSLLSEYMRDSRPLDEPLWTRLICTEPSDRSFNRNLFYKLIYLYGIEGNELRKKVWPYLLGVFTFEMSQAEIDAKVRDINENYSRLMSEWQSVEVHVKQREEEKNITPIKDLSSIISRNDSGIGSEFSNSDSAASSTTSEESKFDRKKNGPSSKAKQMQTPIRSSLASRDKGKITKSNKSKIRWSSPIETRTPVGFRGDTSSGDLDISSILIKAQQKIKNKLNAKSLFSKLIPPPKLAKSTPKSHVIKHSNNDVDMMYTELAQLLVANAIMRAKYELEKDDVVEFSLNEAHINNDNKSPASFYSSPSDMSSNSITNQSSININNSSTSSSYHSSPFLQLESTQDSQKLGVLFKKKRNHDDSSQYMSPILNELIANKDVVDSFAANMHRIDKDVLRCDRNYWYFMCKGNLDKLKNVLYTYIWETLDIGYVQGMCDLVAPLLVLYDDEALAFECFKKTMERLEKNFLYSAEMDRQFEDMSFLVQILDNDLHEYMISRGDHTQFYFTYRWFLLQFKREFSYDEVFGVWETIWAARQTTSEYFHLFIALALVEAYRDIIIENQMDFTNIIKFFNEMTEKHGAKEILSSARSLVDRLINIAFDQN